MFTLKHRKHGITGLAFSPDGATLAAGGSRGHVQLWDLTTKRLTREVSHGGYPHSAVFFAPGGRLLTYSGELLTFDVGTGARVPNGFRVGNAMLLGVAPAPWPVPCLCAAYWDRRSVYCYRLPDGGRLWRAAIDERGAARETAMAFSGDGRAVAVGMSSGPVYVFDAADGQRLWNLDYAGCPEVKALALSPSGAAVAWGAASHLRLWRLGPDAEEVKHVSLGRTHFVGIAWHPSGDFFATANGDGKVDYWDAKTGERRESFDWGVGKLHAVVFDAAGDRAACGAKSGEIVVWDVDR